MKKVTYQQVADALNISRVTVWKAVNDKPGIAPDTKRSILQKAVEMGYPISIADSKNINVVTAPPKANKMNKMLLHNRKKLVILSINSNYLMKHCNLFGSERRNV